MHDHLIRKVWLAGWIVIVTLAAGCFQPAGGGLEATSVAQSLPTFTPIPTDTPSPVPQPTEMPTEQVINLPTATLIPFETVAVPGTQVADVSGQVDPFSQTATASFLEQQPGGFQTFEQPTETIDPGFLTATEMVRQATEMAGAPMTATAQAIFGGITPTMFLIQPTATPIVSVVQGNDCIYEVQPGDRNLYRISLLFGIPYMSIAAATNMVNPNLIHVGDRLTIPGCGVTGYQPPPTSTPSPTYSYPGVTPGPGDGGSGQTYVVQQGDTLFALSLRWNTTVYTIAQLNNIPNINLIYIDQVLYIP